MYRAFESKDVGLKGLVLIETPKENSFFHALAYASFLPYRTGKVLLDDNKSQAISRKDVVAKMISEFSSLLELPVSVDEKKTNYEIAGFTKSLADVQESLKEPVLSLKLIDFVASSQKIQIEVVDSSGKRVHRSPGKDMQYRVAMAADRFGYVLIGHMNKEKVLTTTLAVV